MTEPDLGVSEVVVNSVRYVREEALFAAMQRLDVLKEALAAEHGHLEDVWAGRLNVNRAQARLPLCSSCELRAA